MFVLRGAIEGRFGSRLLEKGQRPGRWLWISLDTWTSDLLHRSCSLPLIPSSGLFFYDQFSKTTFPIVRPVSI